MSPGPGGRGGGRGPGGGGRGNTVPSNYKGLPVASRADRNSSAVAHDRYQAGRLSGRLELRAEVLGAVHMGTGTVDKLPDQNRLYLDIVSTAKNRDCLPGAGLKGPIRSLYEALSSSCPLDGRCEQPNRLCPACSLFGSLGYLGRAGFDEFIDDPKDPVAFGLTRLPTAYPPRLEKGRRIYGRPHPDIEGVKNTYYGVLAQGSKLYGGLWFENVTEAELGLLLLSMGLDRSFTPRFGGGKHGGIGAVRLVPRALNKLDPKERYGGGGKAEPLAGEALERWIGELCQQAESRLDEQQQQALAVTRATMHKDGW